MKTQIERDTYMGALYYFGLFFTFLLYLIGFVLFYSGGIFIKLLTVIIFLMIIIFSIKYEIIPLICHFKNINNQGDILQGKVETINFRGAHFVYSCEIEGYYFVGNSTYYFKDFFCYDDIKYICGLKDLCQSGITLPEIDIKVNVQKPSVYCVCGIEYLMQLKETFPEYFDNNKWY